MPAPPLTHHEILQLVEPFTRRGRHVDLAASDRPARRLVFRPVEHAGAAPHIAPLRETLQLDSFGRDRCLVTRLLDDGTGLQARVQADGTDPGELLARILEVAPLRQFRFGTGYCIARNYALQPNAPGAAAGSPAAQLVLIDALLRVDGLIVTLRLPATRGISAELTIQALGADKPDLPDDLLAVLGWDWARLVGNVDGWTTKLRLRGSALKRTRNAELALDLVAGHLVRTLSEAPARFHERWHAARWGVVARRAIPLLTFVALIVAVLTTSRLGFDARKRSSLLFFQVPTALLALSFCLQELPQFEIPPRPKRSGATHWMQIDNPRPMP
jgi:hypothetical protein